jgi:hypothetical protein
LREEWLNDAGGQPGASEECFPKDRGAFELAMRWESGEEAGIG